jgi:hypothetical protein
MEDNMTTSAETIISITIERGNDEIAYFSEVPI